jgi:hypothetical protein
MIVLEFLRDNWQYVVIGLSAIVEVLVLFVFKRRKSVSPFYEVVSVLPKLIDKVESRIGAGNGAIKKEKVLDAAIVLYEKLTGVCLSKSSKIVKDLDDAIESILTTPQKKGK